MTVIMTAAAGMAVVRRKLLEETRKKDSSCVRVFFGRFQGEVVHADLKNRKIGEVISFTHIH